jgi:hypothetical protein
MRHIVYSERFHVVGNWNGIWKSQVPHKARHLLWPLFRGCLPVISRLSQRLVDCLLLCLICNHDGEDNLYVFFECIAARDSWQTVGLEMVLHNDDYQISTEYVADPIFMICNKEDSCTVGRVATLFWCIWHNWNEQVWNQNKCTTNRVGNRPDQTLTGLSLTYDFSSSLA